MVEPLPGVFPRGTPKRDWRDYWFIVSRRKWIVIHCLWVTVAVVTAASFVLPPKYEARAKILVDRGRVDIPVTPAKTGEPPTQAVTEEDLNSEVEILTSRPLREDVVRRLKLGAEEEGLLRAVMRRIREVLLTLRLLEPLTDEQRAILDFEKKLDVSVIRKSQVIEVVYPDSKPERAADIVNTLVRLYMDRHHQLRQVSGSQEFFRSQAETQRRELDVTESTLREFETREALASVDKQKEATVNKLADFEANVKTTGADIAETLMKIKSLRAQLRQEPARLSTPNRSFQNLAMEEIEKKLVTLEIEANRLRQPYRPDSRRLSDLQEEIRLTRDRLAKAQADAGPLDRTEVNPVHQNLQKDLLSAETTLVALRAKENDTKASVTSYQRKLAGLNEKGYRQISLQRLVKVQEDSYLLYMKKLEETRIEDALNERLMLNIRIAEPAAPPLKPKFPNKPLNILLAVAVGLLGGVSIVLVLDLLDKVVWSQRDIEAGVGLPVLGGVPETPRLLASLDRGSQ